jgi:hypothetical protein
VPPGKRRRGLWAALAIASASALLAACGGEDEPADGLGPPGVGAERAGSVAPLAQCRDWSEGTVDERMATIDDIREQLNQAGNLEPQPDLSNERAYELLDDACAQPYAAGFRLYKIYSRGAAFSSLAPPSE